MKKIDTSGNWSLTVPDGPLQLTMPALLEKVGKKNDLVVIRVPNMQLTIQLAKFDSKQNTATGKYTIDSEPALRGEVILRITDAGKKLWGKPTDFKGSPDMWIFAKLEQ